MTRRYVKRGTPFWDRYEPKESGCWEWSAGRIKGYGSVRVDGRTMYAHRRAWELTHGAIPSGLLVCHRCDNPPCGNPDHLFLGTHADNHRDKVSKGRQSHLRGERHGMTKIPDADVAALRVLRAEGFTLVQLAQMFGISSSYACRLATGDRR